MRTFMYFWLANLSTMVEQFIGAFATELLI
jgi:hypothetical protein